MTQQDDTPATPEADASPPPADDTEAAGSADAADVDALREELERARAQHARAVADYQNLERRSREGRSEAVRLALGGLVAGFLPVLDDLDRAIEASPATGGASGAGAEAQAAALWVEGVRLVAQKFTQVLQQHGVREVPALGEAFDPTHHEAVGTAPGPEGQVVQLLRRGYTLHDQVVRPAMVMVGNGEPLTPDSNGGGATPGDVG